MTVLLAFTIAGYYIDRIRAHATQGGLEAEHEKEDEGEAPSRNMEGATRGPALPVWPGPARLSSPPPSFVLRA
jgi:hypothetical protein